MKHLTDQHMRSEIHDHFTITFVDVVSIITHMCWVYRGCTFYPLQMAWYVGYCTSIVLLLVPEIQQHWSYVTRIQPMLELHLLLMLRRYRISSCVSTESSVLLTLALSGIQMFFHLLSHDVYCHLSCVIGNLQVNFFHKYPGTSYVQARH